MAVRDAEDGPGDPPAASRRPSRGQGGGPAGQHRARHAPATVVSHRRRGRAPPPGRSGAALAAGCPGPAGRTAPPAKGGKGIMRSPGGRRGNVLPKELKGETPATGIYLSRSATIFGSLLSRRPATTESRVAWYRNGGHGGLLSNGQGFFLDDVAARTRGMPCWCSAARSTARLVDGASVLGEETAVAARSAGRLADIYEIEGGSAATGTSWRARKIVRPARHGYDGGTYAVEGCGVVFN